MGAVGRGALQSQRPQGLGWALPLTAAAVTPIGGSHAGQPRSHRPATGSGSANDSTMASYSTCPWTASQTQAGPGCGASQRVLGCFLPEARGLVGWWAGLKSLDCTTLTPQGAISKEVTRFNHRLRTPLRRARRAASRSCPGEHWSRTERLQPARAGRPWTQGPD